MSDKFLVEITDGISPDIDRKLNSIDKSSKSAYRSIKTLQDAVKGLNSVNLPTAAPSPSQKATSSIAKGSGNADALNSQKLQTESIKTQTAIARLEAQLESWVNATNRSAESALRAQAANNLLAKSTNDLAMSEQNLQTATVNRLSAQERLSVSQNQTKTSLQQLSNEQQRFATESAKTATEIQKTIRAQNDANNARLKSNVINNQANLVLQRGATELQRTATELQRTARAQAAANNTAAQGAVVQARVISATASAAAAQSRAEIAAIRLANAHAKAAGAAGQNAQAGEALRRSLDPLYNATAIYNQKLEQARSLFLSSAIDINTYRQAVSVAKAELESTSGAVDRFSKDIKKSGDTAKLASHHMLNLGFQVQDIGVSLASGQNPLTVFIQQGTQIAGIAGQAGVTMGFMARSIALMLLPFAPLVAALAAAYAGFKLFQSVLSDDSGVKGYAESMGASAEEIEKFNLGTVTAMDMVKGLWATFNEYTGAENSLRNFAQGAIDTFKNILQIGKTIFASLYGLVYASVESMKAAFFNLPGPVKDMIGRMASDIAQTIANMVNGAINTINFLANTSNSIFKTSFKTLSAVEAPKINVADTGRNAAEAGKSFAQNYMEGMAKANTGMDDFGKRFSANVVKATRKRIVDTMKKEKIGDFDGKADKGAKAPKGRAAKTAVDNSAKEAEKREKSLLKANNALDEEIRLEQQRGPMFVVNNRLLQIENDLKEKGIKLSGPEVKSLTEKLILIQKLKAENFATDQIKELDQQISLTKLYGKNQEDLAFAIQLKNQAEGAGLSVSEDVVAKLTQKNRLLQDSKILNSEVSQIIETSIGEYDKLTLKLKALTSAYEQGAISKERFELGKSQNAVDKSKLNIENGKGNFEDGAMASLGNYMKDYKGVVQGLSTEFESFFTTINDGFADSFGRAIVQGESLNDALRSVAQQGLQQLISGLIKMGIQWAISETIKSTATTAAIGTTTTASTAAAAATATAWAPAAAAVSLASFGGNIGPALLGMGAAFALGAVLSKGFQKGGYTGNGAVDKISGVTHGQEFVVNAPATAKHRNLLETINNGGDVPSSVLDSSSSSGYGSQAPLNVNIISTVPGVEFEVNRLNEKDVEIIAKRVVQKESDQVTASNLSNPNSKTSKSLYQNTRTQRAFA